MNEQEQELLMGTNPKVLDRAMRTAFAQLRQNSAFKSVVGTPQFPGQQKGFDIEVIRTLIKKQKRSKGFRFEIESGNNEDDINISGTARILLGFAILFDTEQVDFATRPTSMTLTVNNEIIIQDVRPDFFTPDFMDDEYYYFPRPLDGTDDITLQTVGVDDVTLDFIVYYI